MHPSRQGWHVGRNLPGREIPSHPGRHPLRSIFSTQIAFLTERVQLFVFIGKAGHLSSKNHPFQSPLPNAVGMTDPVTPDFNPADWTRCLTRSAVGKGSSQSETQLLSDARWG